MPIVILEQDEISELIKEKYKVDEIKWKTKKGKIEVQFKQELTVTIVDANPKREELKREIKKNLPDGVMTGGERVMSGKF